MAEHVLVTESRKNMDKCVERLERELSKVRTGRASVHLLDGIQVEYYGVPSILSQVASVSNPDARTLVLAPFEKRMLSQIEKAIQKADIGIQPTNDGNVIRLNAPPLSEERRKEIAKSTKKMGEDAKISARKVRQEGNAKIKKLEKNKELPEDYSKQLQKEMQALTDVTTKKIDGIMQKKEQEIMTL